jgi:hypothetical protein
VFSFIERWQQKKRVVEAAVGARKRRKKATLENLSEAFKIKGSWSL